MDSCCCLLLWLTICNVRMLHSFIVMCGIAESSWCGVAGVSTSVDTIKQPGDPGFVEMVM